LPTCSEIGLGPFVRIAALVLASAGVACSPIANLRPASGLMPGKKLEVGAGAAALSPRPFVSEDWEYAGQAWLSGNTSSLVTLSAIGAFDADAVALGGALRLNVLCAHRAALGIEGELGYAWAGLSLPAALRLFDESWVYTAPRIGTWSSDPIFGVPLGLSLRVYDGFAIRGEAQVSWQDFKSFNRRTQWAGALAYQF
jgi:hypothetical protein